MNKLLLVTTKNPFPPKSGVQIRIYNNLLMLRDSYEIDIVYLSTEAVTDDALRQAKEISCNLICFKVSKIRYFLNIIFVIPRARPFQVACYSDPRVHRWMKDNAGHYKAAFFMHVRAALYVKHFDQLKIIDYVDAISMNYQNAARVTLGLKKILYSIEKKRLLKYEVFCSKYFDKNIITSSIDKHFIESNGGNQIQVINHSIINNGANQPDFDGFGEDYTVMFIGAMWYEPNVKAIMHFCVDIFPQIRQKWPNAKCFIVGNRPSKAVIDLEMIDGVVVTGFIQDINPYYAKASVIVAPMISGSGVQTKVIEAFSKGKCVVSSPLGVQGLGAITPNEIVVANNDSSFADEVSFLISQKGREKRKLIGKMAYKYFKDNYSFDSIKKNLLEYISS